MNNIEKIVYQGRFIRATEEIIDGTVFEKVHLKSSMIIFPFDSEGRLIMVREKRIQENPPIKWKPVTGYVEEEGTVEENANRELQEEIGYKANCLKPYFTVRSSGTITGTQYFILASCLVSSKLPNPDGEDTILEVTGFPINEIKQRVLSGEIAQGNMGYGLLKLCLEWEAGQLNIKNLCDCEDPLK